MTRRLKFEFSPEGFARLSRVRALAHLETAAEAVRDALRLYEWFLEKLHAGYTVAVMKDGVVTEVELSFGARRGAS